MITPAVITTIFSLYYLWDLGLIRNVMFHCIWKWLIPVYKKNFFPTARYFSFYTLQLLVLTRFWNEISANQKYALKISYIYLLLCLSQESLPLHSPATLSHTIKEEVQWMQSAYSPQEFPLVEYVKVLPAVSLSGLLGCFGRQRALNENATIAGWFFSSQHW